MTDEVKNAMDWALRTDYTSLAARYCRVLAKALEAQTEKSEKLLESKLDEMKSLKAQVSSLADELLDYKRRSPDGEIVKGEWIISGKNESAMNVRCSHCGYSYGTFGYTKAELMQSKSYQKFCDRCGAQMTVKGASYEANFI